MGAKPRVVNLSFATVENDRQNAFGQIGKVGIYDLITEKYAERSRGLRLSVRSGSTLPVTCLIAFLCLASFPPAAGAKDAAPLALVGLADSVTHRAGHRCYQFRVEGRPAWVVAPSNAAPCRPWVWRSRFPGYHAEVDAELLKRGYFIAYVETANLYGSPAAMEVWNAFYRKLVDEIGLSPKGVLYGVSRGGLFVYNFARQWPERVGVIYADSPIMDFKSWPGGRHGKRSDADWVRLKQIYGFKSDARAMACEDIPVNYAEDLARSKIPIFHVIGPTDVVVPPVENTEAFAARYRAAGGRMMVHSNGPPYNAEGHQFTLDNVSGAVRFIVENTPLPNIPGREWRDLRGGLDRCLTKFRTAKKGRVVYLGGSITQGPGWQNMVSRYIAERFPHCHFEFCNAGIGSLDSSAHAFRWREHVGEPADLVFFEAAVNDLHNRRSATERIRGYEGVIRGILSERPACDIVCLHFSDPHHTADYRAGRVPAVLEDHERVAAHYRLPSLNLAREVTERMDAGQFDWARDFVNLHPSPFGQRLYYQAVKRLLDAAWPENDARASELRNLPAALDLASYTGGRLVNPVGAKALQGFAVVPAWKPTDRAGTRAGFVNCPMLVSTQAGSSFEFSFSGTAIGLFMTAGPDAGVLEYSIDGGEWKTRDTFTQWSRGLHLPWVLMLEADLSRGKHLLRVRLGEERDAQPGRTALRIRWFLVNGA